MVGLIGDSVGSPVDIVGLLVGRSVIILPTARFFLCTTFFSLFDVLIALSAASPPA